MSRCAIRGWFCLAAAVIAAAIADPLVEWASNAGLFGRGAFTDNSNLDVLPALLVGAVLVAAHLAGRVRRALAHRPEIDALRAAREALGTGPVRLLPAIFAAQLLVLCAMETSEQLFVAGRVLGGTIWLGGPVAVSLVAHALVCAGVAFGLSAALRACASSAVRAIRLIRAMATRPVRTARPIELPRPGQCGANLCAFVLRCAGERAPPLPTA